MKRTLLLGVTVLMSGMAAPVFAQDAAAPAQADNGVLVFTPDFFADRRPNTALDMVNRVPGFSLNNGSDRRGFEGAVGNVLIDGVRPASKNDTAGNALGRIPAEQVERIELIRGSAPGVDMQGYSEIVNVILKDGASSETIVTADAIIFDGGRDLTGGGVQHTRRDGTRTWTIRFDDFMSWNDSNGPGRVLRIAGAGNVLRDEFWINDSYGGGPAVRGTYNGPLFGGTVDLTARYAGTSWNEESFQSAVGILRVARTEEDGDAGEFGITWERPLGERHKLETRFIHEFGSWEGANTYAETIGGVDAPFQVFDYSGSRGETIARVLVRREQSSALSFEAGTELAYNMRDTDQAFTIGGTAVPLPSASVKVEEIRGEVFSRGTWRLDPDWTLEAGLRVEASEISQSGGASQSKSFFFPKPRLQMTWTPAPGHQLRVRFERELGQLNFRDFAASAQLTNEVYLGGNVDLEPEQRWIADASYEYRFWDGAVIGVGYRHDEIRNAIDYLPLAGGPAAVGNIGDGTLDRVSLNIVLPTDRLGLKGGRFTFRNDWDDARVTDPTTGLERRMTNSRVSNARINYEQDIPALNLLVGVFLLPQYDRPTFNPNEYQSVRVSNLWEVFAEVKPTPTLSIRGTLSIWDELFIERVVYDDRVARTTQYHQTLDVDPRAFFRINVRKTF